MTIKLLYLSFFLYLVLARNDTNRAARIFTRVSLENKDILLCLYVHVLQICLTAYIYSKLYVPRERIKRPECNE